MTLVGISGAYGAGGSQIGPRLAERLGVPFLDRAIPAAVAERLGTPLEEAAAHDEALATSWFERLLSGFAGMDTGAPVPLPETVASAQEFRQATEEVLRRQIATGEGVILGRGAVILLREHPSALRVRLDGPDERRVAQAMRLQGVDEDTARARMRRQDRTHLAYARHFYDVDLCDRRLYHVVLDSTTLPIDACVELLALAVERLESSDERPDSSAAGSDSFAGKPLG
jgi:cytidylate kinase